MQHIKAGVVMFFLTACLVYAVENELNGSSIEKAAGQSLGPMIQYHAPGKAAISWETEKPSASVVCLFLNGKQIDQVEDSAPKTRHTLTFKNLEPNTVYQYALHTNINGMESESGFYFFDTTFNYTLPAVDSAMTLFPEDNLTDIYSAAADRIVAETGIQQGYAVVYGLGEGRLAYELLKRTNLIVVGLDEKKEQVTAVRALMKDTGLYGTRITVRHVESLDMTPLTSRFANLIVSDDAVKTGMPPGNSAEVLRLLRPSGGVAFIGGGTNPADDSVLQTWLEDSVGVAKTTTSEITDEGWIHIVRAAQPGSGSWTHQYGGVDNSANSGEELGGAGAVTDLEIQWLGRPGADFGIDRNPRMPAPLAVNGRLFHQGLNRMVALDAYNGALLWLSEIPALRRVNIPRDSSNWCADNNFLYAAVENCLWQVEAQTGTLAKTYPLPKDRQKGYDWGFVAQVDNTIYGSSVVRNAMYTDFWGKASWYDGTSGAGTFKICSDKLFAYKKDSGDPLWSYEKGAIINSTITLGDGRIYFVESRHTDLSENRTGRIDKDVLWLDQFLVALDDHTGKKIWEEPIDTADGIVVFFLSYAEEHLLLTASTAGSYYLYGYKADTGKSTWDTRHPWLNDNHGTHMQHVAIAGGTAYIEPIGYNIKTGEVVTEKMGRREGCSAVIATNHALIYRGQQRRTAMWDLQSEKVTAWVNLRPSCWLSTITADGLLLAPEGGGGCSCGGWIETSVCFAPVINMKKGE